MTDLTDHQMMLLLNLTVLEDKGLISGPSTIFLYPGHDEVDSPPTVTSEGRRCVSQYIESGQTLLV